MMRLDSGGTATATASAQQGPPQQQAASAAMSMSAMSASASSDFMGNQLASYFSQLFEKNPQEQVLQGKEKRKTKKSKKSKTKEKRKMEPITDMYPSLPQVSIPKNPSPFAVFAAIRNTCLENKRKQDTILQMQSAAAWKEVEDSSNDPNGPESSSDSELAKKIANLPKIVGIGLQGVFEIIRESQNQYPSICRRALESLSDILGGLQPEELANEPPTVIEPMFDTLLELTTADVDDDEIRALASSCILSLAVAYGDTGKTLLASSAMLMSQPRGNDDIYMPPILVSLQRSVISVMLGKLDHPSFMSQGLMTSSLLDTFEVKFRKQPEVVHSLTSDGSYLYFQTSEGLFKVGSGYGGTIKGHVYCYNKDFYSKPGWLGHASGCIYFKPSTGCVDFNLIKSEDLSVAKVLSSANESTFSKPCAMFSDGVHIGVIVVDVNDRFTVKFLNACNCSSVESELPLKLARKSIDVFGSSIIEEGKTKHQVDFASDDDVLSLQSGKEFALMLTSHGRIYYTGKSTALGQKQPCPNGQWNEMTISKSPKIVQLAVGHEGLHSLLLSEDGTVYFVGTARRGEDGDQTKARRPPKPVKPKVFNRMDGQTVSHVAANSGTSAVVTKNGDLFLFGKDSTQCDWSGQVIEMKGHHVTQVALGKAHVVVLTRDGEVFTFGMNNKGQCGREFTNPKDQVPSLPVATPLGASASAASEAIEDVNSDHDLDTEQESSLSEVGMCPNGKHKWKHDQCMICTICGECTGYGSHCVSAGRPDRNPGMFCGCGSGDSGCGECGCCRACAGEDGDIAGAAAAAASEKARLQDRLIRMEYLAAETKERYLGPAGGGAAAGVAAGAAGESEKFIGRRMQKMENCPRSRRAMKNRLAALKSRERRLLIALESSMNKERNVQGVGQVPQQNAMSAAAVAAAAASQASASDAEKESGGKLASLSPANLNLGSKICQIATGLQHTLLLSTEGEVFTFGSNNYGQLGTLDLNPRGSPTLITLPSKAISIACGSYHSVILLDNGQVCTFGNYQKGQLGRECNYVHGKNSPDSREEICLQKLWFAFPDAISGIGNDHGRSATWIGASGDQTFIRVDETLINAKSLMNSTIMANKHQILLLPSEDTCNFKSVAISRHDGFCKSFNGPEQADFTGKTVNLDPIYNVIWAYDNGTLSSYHPVVTNSETNKTFKESILTPELALPLAAKTSVSRNQASLNMLSCLDTLSHCPEVNLTTTEEETAKNANSGKNFSKEDFTAVNRFDNHGGGWGYSGHSIEAIRFMVDTDILLGGFGLFGGRGEYVGKIKLFDIGTEGGDQEGDGDLLAESDEVAYECGARQKYPILFDEAVTIHAGRWYVAWARVSGPSSDCGSSGQAQVTTDDQIQFYFKSSKKSNNGTDVNAGQLPQLLYKLISAENSQTHRRYDPQEPVSVLSPKFAKRVTPDCFHALLGLIKWSWNAFKAGLCELMEIGDGPDTTSQPVICDLQRLIYVCRACLRLTVSYTEVVYPARILPNCKPLAETQKLAETIYDCRSLLQQILTDGLSVLQNSSNFSQHKTGLNLTKMVMLDAHRSFVACFHAFYPTGYLKWACLCNLLASMEANPDTINTAMNYDRLLTAVLDALCNPMIKLRNTFPITYSPETETRCKNFSPTENLSITTSMIQAGDTNVHQFPILNELMNFRSHMDGIRFGSWTFREVLDRLLAISSAPVKQALKGDPGSPAYSKELVEKSCLVVSSVISELANQTMSGETDLQCLGGRVLHTTPNRFTRTSNNRTWNTGNGSPDAICFSVDRPGIFIVGCCVYGGMGTYEYELELLDDQSSGLNEKCSDHGSQQRWTSQEIAHGSYSAEDCMSDIAELKFERAVAIKPHVKYALRLRNHGGRTSNGDGGISSAKGPDGTTFSFSSCSLSFNGTNPTRGQLPQILYFSSPQENDVQASTKNLAETYARRTALSMTSAIVKVVTGLLIQARENLEDEKGFEALNSAPIITKLMPHILASISSLATSDPPSAVQVLTFIQEILPSVASLQNLYLLSQENLSSDDEDNLKTKKASEAVSEDLEAASQHYAWVESEHPYKAASVNVYRVQFPSSVQWMSVEFDPQCSTTQPEDVLQLYIRNRNTEKASASNNKLDEGQMNEKLTQATTAAAAAATATSVINQNELASQKYTPVLKKFSEATNWPRQNVILPGNEVLFSLETASDYVKDDKNSNFGFKCLVVGYEGFSNKDDGLRSLEMELSYLGGICAASLMKKSIPLQTSSGTSTTGSSQTATSSKDGYETESKEDMEIIEDSASEVFEMHASLLSKGFGLERPPNVHQALDSVIPFSSNSNERVFLRNFVNCVPGTSGGRLARWLQPESFVDVDQCEVLFNDLQDLKCNWPTIITIITRDQYGDVVQVPELKVEVNAVPIEEINQSVTRLRKMAAPDAMTFGGHRPPSLEPKYEVTVKDKMLYHAITVQPAYENYSFEELRYASPALQRQSETMLVRPNNDGTYSANWTPGNIGFYQIHVVIDNCEMSEPYKVEVRDPPQGVAPPHPTKKSSHPGDHSMNRLRKFIAKPSAGLRIRIHPTLQSEQIGVVPVEGTISIVDEYHNADGIWVRLGQESLLEFCSVASYSEGWCLQYNQHLEKTLLVPISESKKVHEATKPQSTASASVASASTSLPNPFNSSNVEPLLKPTERPDWKTKKPRGPGTYTVIKCGASGHNIRSNPNLLAPPIGMLAQGDQITVVRTKEINDEIWVQIESEAAQKHCFSYDEGDAWSLAFNSDILYLEATHRMVLSSEDATSMTSNATRASRSMSRPITVIPPPSSSQIATASKAVSEAAALPTTTTQKPIPPPKKELMIEAAAASASRTRTPSPKPSFFQKWFKGEAIKRASGSQSPSPTTQRKSTSSLPATTAATSASTAASAVAGVNRDIPPELIGVSVKELVKVIGESRANGNGVTPPGTPATPRRSASSRSASPQVSSSRGSSPSSVRLTSGSLMTTAQRAASKSPLSHEGAAGGLGGLNRQDSSDNSTSNLISSLTRDVSQSSHEGSASPSLSMRSELELPREINGSSKTLSASNTTEETTTPTAAAAALPQPAASVPKKQHLKRKSSSCSSPRSGSSSSRSRSSGLKRGQPVKEALSPSVAESIRAVFAAFVWHEGIVHDTMAVASYLKFHPNLAKHPEVEPKGQEQKRQPRQRHSVEVSLSAYMNANNLESLNTSNANNRNNISAGIPEGETLALSTDLPPTIKLLVYLWDEVKSYCIQAILQQMIIASPTGLNTMKSYSKKEKSKSVGRKRKSRSGIPADDTAGIYEAEAAAASTAVAVTGKVLEEAFHQLCEMCGHYFQHPVTYHMRTAHPGCGGHAGSKGYNSGGHYCGGWAGNCGDGGVGGSSWYLICEKCRSAHMSRHQNIDAKNRTNILKQPRKKSLVSFPVASSSPNHINSHIIMTNNAMFLLDLASEASNNLLFGNQSSSLNRKSTNSMMSSSMLNSVSELSNMDPNPFPLVPFQCFHKLGVRDSHLRLINDELVLDEVLKSDLSCENEGAEITPPEPFQNEKKAAAAAANATNFSRSASVEHSVPENDVLTKPSEALQKLFIKGQNEGQQNVIDILQRPVLSFVLQWNDLESLQIAMTQGLRKAVCRSFALQALNWLLRSVSQPACLHDLLWCFVSALESNSTFEVIQNQNMNQMDDKKLLVGKKDLTKAKNEGLFDHPSEDISIAGDAIQPLPAIFHGLLQTVSDLMLLLPVGSSLQQIAITCWCIKFRPQDHQFLHQSHVFSTISKILSRSEEFEGSNEKSSSNEESETTVEDLVDVTSALDLKVSSRVAMVNSLNDNSTETFWESSDEDRNKSKWVTASIKPNEGQKVSLRSISVHIDNGRDLGNKVSHLTFKGGLNAEDLSVLKSVDVESRFAGWITCFIDCRETSFLRIEAKGPDNTLRLRQVKALGCFDSMLQPHKQPRANLIQQKNCEAETLRVFRLITSQVFGRLLEESEGASVASEAVEVISGEAEEQPQESYLKEHVVGILFSRSKLTHLQKQVCSHIVGAIKKEAGRLRDDWDVHLCSGGRDHDPVSDTYCFEMMSLVLALSGSAVGRTHLASQYGFIKDLLALLHTASGRIQRQVIALLRRILPEVRPQTFASLLGISELPPKDFGILARSTASEAIPDIGILDVFLSCISKALTLQVKSKLDKESGKSKTHLMTVNLASSIHPRDPTGPRWWLRGTMTKKIAEEIIHLLKDMTCGGINNEWADITKSAVAEAILNLTRIDEGHREPTECLKYPVLWLALASLCVLDKDHVDGLSSGEYNEAAASRPTCDNHDDGETLAIILCDVCGNLCVDCDRYLHLHRKTKGHQRQVFKEEEDAIKVDLHEGCGRTKLFWLLALADSLTLKAMVEFREGGRGQSKGNFSSSGTNMPSNFSTCRFCLRQSTPDHPVMDSLCTDKECIEYSKTACTKALTCGHFCGGIKDEEVCLPCLHGCSGSAGLRQDADDMCMICFTEALWPIPSIQLECGHVFHFACCRKILEKRWTGPRITFGFRNCPICKAKIRHPALKPLMDPIDALYEDVKKKSLMRLEYEGLSKSDAVMAKGARFYNDPTSFALERYAYYVCYKCGKAYYGGEAQCDADAGQGDDYNPEELVCGGCSDVSRAQMCPKHGTDYLEYKCRYCCSVAVFFCFGTTHFCNACHDDFQRVANVPKHELPQCPVGPKSVQLESEECPLHVSHPPTGEEYALGCGVCRNAHTF